MSDIDPTIVESAARSLISARKSQGGGIEIDLPVLYPDGQGVSVSVARENGSWCVSDQGLSVMYLTSYGVKVRRDLRHRFVQEVSQYGCEFFEGKVYRVCSAEQIPVAAAFVANAARTVGDYAREIRQSTATSFKDAVEQAVSSSRLCDRIRRRRSYRGKSGRQYRVTYVRMDETEERPEAFIEIISQRSPYRVTSWSLLISVKNIDR